MTETVKFCVDCKHYSIHGCGRRGLRNLVTGVPEFDSCEEQRNTVTFSYDKLISCGRNARFFEEKGKIICKKMS